MTETRLLPFLERGERRGNKSIIRSILESATISRRLRALVGMYNLEALSQIIVNSSILLSVAIFQL